MTGPTRTHRFTLARSALAGSVALIALTAPSHGQEGASATTPKKARVTLLDKITRRTTSTIDDPPEVDPGYELVNLFAEWQANDDLKFAAGVENIFNASYTDPQSSWAGSALTEQGKGRTLKISVTGRIGG